MARASVLPDLGEGLTEAEIRQVLVREGEVVREDAPLLEVETDKATVEIPSPMAGRIEKIHVQPGQTVKVGQVLVEFGDAGDGKSTGGKQAADTLDPTRKLAPEPTTVVAEGRARQVPTTAAPVAPSEPATAGLRAHAGAGAPARGPRRPHRPPRTHPPQPRGGQGPGRDADAHGLPAEGGRAGAGGAPALQRGPRSRRRRADPQALR